MANSNQRSPVPGISFSEPNGTTPTATFRSWPARTIRTTSLRSTQAGLVELIDGDCRDCSRASAHNSPAATPAAIRSFISNQRGESAVCLADLCPTAAHLQSFWTMAYDQFPLDVRRKKPIVLNDIAEHQRIALFSHDPHITAAWLSPGAERMERYVATAPS